MRGFRPTSIRPASMRFAVPTANASIVRCCRPAAATATSAKKGNGGSRSNNAQAALNLRAVHNELVAEIDGALSDRARPMNWRGVMAWSASPRRVFRCSAPPSACSASSTAGRWTRCAANSPPTAACARCSSISATSCRIRRSPRSRAMPRNTRVAQLRLPQAHALARGMNVTIAVIDSGIDVKHPELANSVADSFDALGSKRRSACPRHRHCRRDRRACAG